MERLDKTGMVFQLNDGTILKIRDEDAKDISDRIVLNMITNREIKVVINRDNNITKAQQLHEVLTREKGMPSELRVQYYEEILKLYKESGTSYTEEDFRKNDKNKP